MPADLVIRPATAADVPALDALIRRSVTELQAGDYTPEQREAALGSVFGVDHRLIADSSYLVAERDGVIVGCGGWSDRAALYGAHGPAESDGPRVSPKSGPARIRAFFVDPACARQGVGTAILKACEAAARERGFTLATLSATIVGARLYSAHGWVAKARGEADLPGGGALAVVHMDKRLV